MDKRITTLTIKGLNTSMPDLTVPDGACEKLMNMRFRDGSWRNVGALQMSENIPLPADVVGNHFEFLGVHEVEGVNHYLGKGVIESEDDADKVYNDLHLYAYVNGEWADLGMFASIYGTSTSFTEALATDIRVTSFGNTLIVSTENTTSYFIFSNEKYNIFRMPEPPSIVTTIAEGNVVDVEPDKTLENTGIALWYLIDAANNSIMRPVNNGKNNMWWGEICYLVAYRMKDGSTISPSKLQIACSEGTNTKEFYIGKGKVGEDKYFGAVQISDDINTDHSMPLLRHFIPTIEISIPEGIDTSVVDRVAIFSTRINSILDYGKMLSTEIFDFDSETTTYDGVPAVGYSQLYADNNLPNQPLYLVEEKKIDEINKNGNIWSLNLGYDKLRDISTNPTVYEAVQVHTFTSEAMYDYNQRMHFGGLLTTLYSHTPNVSALYPKQGFVLDGYNELVELENGSGVLSTGILPQESDEDYEIVFTNPIISYPDYRANKLSVVGFYANGKHTFEPNFQFHLKPATANNFAYHILSGTNNKYATKKVFLAGNMGYTSILPLPSPTLSEPNRIQVSAPNNPFSLPFQNSYTVGNEGSRVEAMNTVADSLVDSNFYGAYPLYIFTTDGIFALRAGSGEVLYAGTEIINHDKINNPRTIALNGSVVYACSEGLKALTGRQAVRISADIDPLTWAEAQFGINWEYGELLCRMANGEVFVWNIAAGAWSQRDDVVGSLRGSYAGEVTKQGSLVVRDINKETIGQTNVMLVTRPLKFDSIGFKKLDTLIARIASSLPCNWTIKVESSNDCREWRVIKNVVVEENLADVGIRRFSQSARFYRITISGATKRIVPITQIDIQLQDRYNNKLR